MEILTINAGVSTRTEYLNGREYIVAPLSLIVPGVLPGSRGPLLYPPDEVRNSSSSWSNVPLTLGHPVANGANVSAKAPGVLNRVGMGFVRSPSFSQGKLRAEGWFDVQNTRRIAPHVYDSLKQGRPVELSTGLFTDNEMAANGSHHMGRSYTHVARNYRPDHVAVLVNETGACSLRDGCGVLVNRLVANSSMSEVVDGSCKCGGACKNGKPGKKKGLPMKIPTGNAAMNTFSGIVNQRSVSVANCGGKGGKPGPCPTGVSLSGRLAEREAKWAQQDLTPTPDLSKMQQAQRQSYLFQHAHRLADRAGQKAAKSGASEDHDAAAKAYTTASMYDPENRESHLSSAKYHKVSSKAKKVKTVPPKNGPVANCKATGKRGPCKGWKGVKAPAGTPEARKTDPMSKLKTKVSSTEAWAKKWGPAQGQVQGHDRADSSKVPIGTPKIKGGNVPSGLKKGVKSDFGGEVTDFSQGAKQKVADLMGKPRPPAGFKHRMAKKTKVPSK